MSVMTETISVFDAAKLLGISRNSAYEAARTGQIPVIRVGRLMRVPRRPLHKMLGLPPYDGDAAAAG